MLAQRSAQHRAVEAEHAEAVRQLRLAETKAAVAAWKACLARTPRMVLEAVDSPGLGRILGSAYLRD